VPTFMDQMIIISVLCKFHLPITCVALLVEHTYLHPQVRAWQSEALQSDDHGSNESGIAKSSRELFACLNAVETGAAQVVEEVARSCFERAHIHGHSSSSGGGSLDMRSGNVSGGGFGGFLGGEIGGRGAYSRGHSSTSPAGYHSGSGGGSGRLLTEVWGGVQTSAAEDDNADLRILVVNAYGTEMLSPLACFLLFCSFVFVLFLNKKRL